MNINLGDHYSLKKLFFLNWIFEPLYFLKLRPILDSLSFFLGGILILGQKSYYLGPTIFKIPQPNRHYYATYRQWMSSLMPFFPLWGTSGLLLSSFRLLFFIIILSVDWFLWDYRIHRSSSRKLCVFRITLFFITEKFRKLLKNCINFLKATFNWNK